VHSGGSRSLWTDIEHGHAEWDRLGRPGWDRLGLTITSEGRYLLWCDNSDHVVTTVGILGQTFRGL
jgi:hypothetical protein